MFEKDRTRVTRRPTDSRRTFPAPNNEPSRPDHPARFTGCKGHLEEQTRLHRGDGNLVGAGADQPRAAGLLGGLEAGPGRSPRGLRRSERRREAALRVEAQRAREQEKTLRQQVTAAEGEALMQSYASDMQAERAVANSDLPWPVPPGQPSAEVSRRPRSAGWSGVISGNRAGGNRINPR